MKNFNNFINEQYEPIEIGEKGKLSIETDNSEYNEEWKITLTLEKTWKKYSEKSISLSEFNNIYASTLIENKQQINSACGNDAWSSLEPVTTELKNASSIEDSEKIYDKLYDVFDKYEIHINTGTIQQEILESSMEQQNYSVGDIVRVDFYGEEVTARISKINTKNSYLIQIEQNSSFLPKEHSIKGEQILDMGTPFN